MTLLDRYFFRSLLAVFVAVLAFCAVIVLVAMFFEKLPDILDRDVPWDVAGEYFLCALPWRVVQVMPLAAVLAVLLGIGNLSVTNEVLAVLTSGVSVIRLGVPLVVFGIMVMGGTVMINEVFVPKLQQRAQELELKIEGRDITRTATTQDLLAQGRDNRFYLMKLYASYNHRMIEPLVVDLTPDFGSVRRRIQADEARLESNHPSEHYSKWNVLNARSWTYDIKGNVTTYTASLGWSKFQFEEDLHLLLSRSKEPEQMTFRELWQHVHLLAERHQPTEGLRTELWMKLSFPVGTFVLILLSLSYAVRMRAKNRSTLLGQGLAWPFAYYGLIALLRAFGSAGILAPVVAAFTPQVILAGCAAVLVSRSARWHN